MRYLWTPGRGKVMHIAEYDLVGRMTGRSLCGRQGFSRSITAPWRLQRRECLRCATVAGQYR